MEGEREMEEDVLFTDSLPKCLEQPGPGWARSQELNAGFPWERQGHSCLSQHFLHIPHLRAEEVSTASTGRRDSQPGHPPGDAGVFNH